MNWKKKCVNGIRVLNCNMKLSELMIILAGLDGAMEMILKLLGICVCVKYLML
jgi:hypothetical protein